MHMARQLDRPHADTRYRLLALIIALASLTLPGACTAQQRGGSQGSAGTSFQIAVFGDMPYINGIKEPKPVLEAYARVVEAIDASHAAFIVHLGDITNGPYCGDSVVQVRYREFQSLSSPFYYTFGYNEWTDCARGGFDPLERLEHLRSVFTQGDSSLGARKLPLERQSSATGLAKYRENVRWRMGNVLFVALDVPGSNNNWGPDSTKPSAEYLERNGANLKWLSESFALAKSEKMLGIAIFIQADPMFDRSVLPPEDRRYFTGFDEFLKSLHDLTVAFGKPVTLVHGDSHYFLIDKPMTDAEGHVVANFTRAESFGAVNMHWLRITVDPADPNLFSFTPMIVPANVVR
jgi:hypothetical protein